MKANKSDFAQASLEVAGGKVDDGLFAMAASHALGDEAKSRAIYLGLRAEEIATERVNVLVKSTVLSVKRSTKNWFDYALSVLLFTWLFTLITWPLTMVVNAYVSLKLGDIGIAVVGTFLGFTAALNWVDYRKRRQDSSSDP